LSAVSGADRAVSGADRARVGRAGGAKDVDRVGGARVGPASGAHHARTLAQWVVLVVVGAGALLMVSPLLLMLLNAFKSPADYSSAGPLSWPSSMYWQGVVTFWTRTDFAVKLWNSIWISSLVALFGTTLSLLSAFALGIGRVKGRVVLVGVFLLANMLPQEVLIYPLFTMAQKAHLGDSGWSVVIIFTVIQSAFGTYLLASVLGTFPTALLEAAQIDGASRWSVLWRVVFPIVAPTCSVLMIFFFIWTWNEFFMPLVLLTSSHSQTVPIALAAMQGDRLLDVPTLNAGALLSLIPTLIFFLVFQRTLTRGIAVGAVK
jgi:raffinose/stachyose/melibiose transport system permease protein